ncbi:MAG: TIGR03564 family F420-dependent LLM class oxidoreductase [Acidimicrobiales bacterium]|nr:TIGR03564 family F420-dependent LLM class oxidoreductase [Acidimicrobiales bacterium]
MRIGLPGGGATVDKIVEQAQKAEADGFSSLWYASAIAGGDPMAAMAAAGRATSTIELGTSVLVTYACHPVLQAYRTAGLAAAVGAGRITLGMGPSHQPVIEGMFGIPYDTAGRHTDEYIQILAALLRGEAVRFQGDEFNVNAAPAQLVDGQAVPVLVAALANRLLRVAGQYADGTILWMGNATSIRNHVAPRIGDAATGAGKAAPRIVAGLPVAVHDDVDATRAEAAKQFVMYGQLPNYQRILAHGEVDGPGDAAIVGDEASVAAQIEELFAAGATDVWAAPFPVGDDRAESRRRTRALLTELANS